MKNFKKFLEELDIKGHSGIPGEGGKRPGESDYLRDVEARAKQKLQITGREDAIGELMRSAQQLQRLCAGKERELEKLAEKVIKDMYAPVIESYNIKLDIKFIDPGSMVGEQRAKKFWDRGNVTHFDQEKMKGKRPVVRARGFDFSMLLHEAVKGIWLILSSNAIPKDKELAAQIKRNITVLDEPEDWRYGPELAADLRDFVNENPKIDKHPNLREFLWEKMTHQDTMSSEDFVELFRGILSKTAKARKIIDILIDEVIEEQEEYDKAMRKYQQELDEYNRKLAEYEASLKGKPVEEEEEPEVVDTDEDATDMSAYEGMTERELDREIDAALDEGNFDLVSALSDLKEKKFG
jgi:hypothetical protein